MTTAFFGSLIVTASLAAQFPTPPFTAGEQLEYSVSFGPFRVGHASMTLTSGDTARGRPAFHAVFLLRGGTFFYRVNDRIESWFDSVSFASLRFTQNIREGRYRADRHFEIYPERGVYASQAGEENASVVLPLDDASFLYFIRTVPLNVGATYQYDRYFQPEGNPVIIRVLRREEITVPAGTFDAVVIQPEIRTQGIFAQKGRAEVWIHASGAHELLQVKSHLVFGSISLYLTNITHITSGAGVALPHRRR